MSASQVTVSVVVAAVVGGGLAWWMFSRAPANEPQVQPPVVEPRVEEPPPTPAAATGQLNAPDEPADDEIRMLELPDGSSVAPLNGVKQPAAIVWQSPQYSPIVGKRMDNGVEWYVHADGSLTTTVMLWRSDLQRPDAITWTLHPGEARPTEPIGPGEPPAGNGK